MASPAALRTSGTPTCSRAPVGRVSPESECRARAGDGGGVAEESHDVCNAGAAPRDGTAQRVRATPNRCNTSRRHPERHFTSGDFGSDLSVALGAARIGKYRRKKGASRTADPPLRWQRGRARGCACRGCARRRCACPAARERPLRDHKVVEGDDGFVSGEVGVGPGLNGERQIRGARVGRVDGKPVPRIESIPCHRGSRANETQSPRGIGGAYESHDPVRRSEIRQVDFARISQEFVGREADPLDCDIAGAESQPDSARVGPGRQIEVDSDVEVPSEGAETGVLPQSLPGRFRCDGISWQGDLEGVIVLRRFRSCALTFGRPEGLVGRVVVEVVSATVGPIHRTIRRRSGSAGTTAVHVVLRMATVQLGKVDPAAFAGTEGVRVAGLFAIMLILERAKDEPMHRGSARERLPRRAGALAWASRPCLAAY